MESNMSQKCCRCRKIKEKISGFKIKKSGAYCRMCFECNNNIRNYKIECKEFSSDEIKRLEIEKQGYTDEQAKLWRAEQIDDYNDSELDSDEYEERMSR